MKKILSFCMVLLLLAISAVVVALGAEDSHEVEFDYEVKDLLDIPADTEEVETEEMKAALHGVIVETTEEYFVIEDETMGTVQINFGEETFFDGMDAQMLTAGLLVDVQYNGMMTRSLPPQVFAEEVAISVEATPGEAEVIEEIFELQGEITEVTEEYFVIETVQQGAVQVNFGEETLFEGIDAQTIAVGQFVIIYYNGMMTRSLPPQVFALKAGVYPVSGEVTEIGEGQMTIVRGEFGDEVIVFLPEIEQEIAVGDQVTVYTNGAMTMSLPAQTTALAVVVAE